MPLLLGEGKAHGPGPGDGAARAGRPADQLRRPLPGPALRRPAAAGRRGPRAGRRPAGDADGRAVQRGRPGRARAAAGRVPAAAGRARQDHPVRHPRHRRGDQARRPGRRAAGRAACSPSSPPPPSCWPTRTTTSSPTSSGATAATARSPSAAAPGAADPAEPSVPLGATAGAGRARSRSTAGCWSSTTTAARWAGSSRPGSTAACIAADRLHRGGTVARVDGSLRGALDAALSSPSRRGVHRRRRRAAARHRARARGAGRHRGRSSGPRPHAEDLQPVGTPVDDLVPRAHLGRGARQLTVPAPRPCALGAAAADRAGSSRCRWAGWPAATGWLYPPLIVGTGLLYTIPSLALFIADAAASSAPRSSTRSTSSSR